MRSLWRHEIRDRVFQIQHDSSIAIADLFHPGPDDFTRSNERVEVIVCVISDAAWKDFAFQVGCEECCSLQNLDCIQEGVESFSANRDALPPCAEPCENALFDWFYFAPELGEALAADLLKDLRIAPFPMAAVWTELPF